ncbi:hypothetical protein HGP14_15810 [Rhizobium sp. P32RR-XVIII]|uniref:hypothetical protein n=1 Tax=Rhizobium sp. P32RR-XVIII TaxID=2726738 RepID=UPI0014573083|nr:hypothetical protein [Rhizobium sp. P32RR-XVIII]NLS04822.1 hypothetical protein [Rhizobium sp. P32RR-XVIII]
MKIVLSEYQQYAALAAAAIILVVLYLQIADDGFSGFGWVLGVLAAAVLVILGIGPVGNAAAPARAPAHVSPTKEELEVGRQKLRESAELLAIEVEERTTILERDLAGARLAASIPFPPCDTVLVERTRLRPPDLLRLTTSPIETRSGKVTC